MSKQVILRLLTGDLQQDTQVILSIESMGADQTLLRTEVSGVLPANPQLADTLQQWQSYYHGLGETRIQPNGIHLNRRQESINACQQLEPKVRSQFNNWLLADSFRAIRDKWLAELMKEEILVLVRTTEPSLLRIPWYLWDLVEQNPSAEVALNVFNTEPISPPTITTPRSKVRILAILGNREGIDIESDRQLLHQLTDAETTFLVEPQRTEINDHLWEQEWDILFFAGHSRTEGDRGRIYINQTDSLTISELRHALQKAVANGLQLAIFNSCDGLGLALELQQVQLPQVIVMREPVTDRVAQAFLRYFLPAFASGQPLHLAVREARLRLQGLENELPGASWLPIIVQAAITTSLTWQQLGHRLKSPPTEYWWQAPLPAIDKTPVASAAFSKKAGIFGLLAIGVILGIIWLNNTKTNNLKATSCQDEIQYRSLSGKVPTAIQIINKRKLPIKVYWLNYQGERQYYFDLEAGKKRHQKTFVSHPWLITDNQNSPTCLGIFSPTNKLGSIILD
jgi:CHAT domain/VHL beta domain